MSGAAINQDHQTYRKHSTKQRETKLEIDLIKSGNFRCGHYYWADNFSMIMDDWDDQDVPPELVQTSTDPDPEEPVKVPITIVTGKYTSMYPPAGDLLT